MGDIVKFAEQPSASWTRSSRTSGSARQPRPLPGLRARHHGEPQGLLLLVTDDPGCGFVIWKSKAGKRCRWHRSRADQDRADRKTVTGFKGRSGKSFRSRLALYADRGGEVAGRVRRAMGEGGSEAARRGASQRPAEPPPARTAPRRPRSPECRGAGDRSGAVVGPRHHRLVPCNSCSARQLRQGGGGAGRLRRGRAARRAPGRADRRGRPPLPRELAARGVVFGSVSPSRGWRGRSPSAPATPAFGSPTSSATGCCATSWPDSSLSRWAGRPRRPGSVWPPAS